jgi:2-desacetyl-2-hydroxyethyl bacteriochlorophyllide A dehydrogenase
MPKTLVLTEPGSLRLSSYDETPLKPSEVRAQAIASGISHGTELNLYRGTAPFHSKQFDPDLRLFVEAPDYRPYPTGLGYEWVGRVIETGTEVTSLQAGDLVHLPFNHRHTHTFVATSQTMYGSIEPLPVKFDPDQAVVLSLAGTALQAVHDASIKIGDRVAVFGLGVIGLLTIQLARLEGAGWIDAIDPIQARRTLAQEQGVDRVLDPSVCDVGVEIKIASSHRGADVAIEVSGNSSALHDAIRSVRVGGTVVAAGYYQGGATSLRLGEEWHHNRVTMVSSMGVWWCPHRDYPLWDIARVRDTAIDLLTTGQLRTDGLISHRIPFEHAAEAYELIDHRPEETVKVVLVY